MKKRNLLINIILLTASTMTLGFISMAFRIYLSNKIGAEGMGLFQLIMSINIVCQTLAISGIRVTMTRLVAEEIGKGNNHLLKNIVLKGILYVLALLLDFYYLTYQNLFPYHGSKMSELLYL